MTIQQTCSLIHKNGLTFVLNVYPNYTDPEYIPQDSNQGDNNPIDTTNRIKAALEMDGWMLIAAGQGETNPNFHYWHFIRTIVY